MRKKIIKISSIVATTLLVISALYVGYRKIERNRIQAENSMSEMQEKLEGQSGVIDKQQAKIEELQGFREEQQQANEQISEQDSQNKKENCEARLKKTQDNLADSQRHLGEDQSVLKIAESDKCNDCYTNCLKSYSCDKSSCDEKIKKQCKKNHEKNIEFRKQDVAGDLEGIRKYEAELISVKNECSHYLVL